jgi:acyl carrier protein
MFMVDQVGPNARSQWPTLPRSINIDEILEIVSTRANIERSALVPSATMQSLNIPSLDMVEILFELEEKFDVYISMGDELVSAVDLHDFVSVLADLMDGKVSTPEILD